MEIKSLGRKFTYFTVWSVPSAHVQGFRPPLITQFIIHFYALYFQCISNSSEVRVFHQVWIKLTCSWLVKNRKRKWPPLFTMIFVLCLQIWTHDVWEWYLVRLCLVRRISVCSLNFGEWVKTFEIWLKCVYAYYHDRLLYIGTHAYWMRSTVITQLCRTLAYHQIYQEYVMFYMPGFH